eukprot:gene24240-10348_t
MKPSIATCAVVATSLLVTLARGEDVVCVDHTVDGYYASKNDAVRMKLPDGATYVDRPDTITECELAQLHRDCVERINLYREGTLIFSNGEQSASVVAGRTPLTELSAANQCSSSQAFGDLVQNVEGGGGCAGGHHTAGTCPWSGSYGQNSCCGRGGGSWNNFKKINTYASVKAELFSCLQQMWDEGEADYVGVTGHYDTMVSDNLQYASCGFAWTTEGRVMMNQDFTKNIPSDFKDTECHCNGKKAGAADACASKFGGGACVNGAGAGGNHQGEDKDEEGDSDNGNNPQISTKPPSVEITTQPSPDCSDIFPPNLKMTSNGNLITECAKATRFCGHSIFGTQHCLASCNKCANDANDDGNETPSDAEDTNSCTDTFPPNFSASVSGQAVTTCSVAKTHFCNYMGAPYCMRSCNKCQSTEDPTTVPTIAPTNGGGSTTDTDGDGGCSAVAPGSRGKCETCFHKSQCIDGYYCCPFMRKCVATSSMSCYSPTARCSPRCSDSTCILGVGCPDCSGCNIGGHTWLEWANLANSANPNTVGDKTCTSDDGTAVAPTAAPTPAPTAAPAPDPCNAIKCGKLCTGECGWSKAVTTSGLDGTCIS